MNNGKLSIHKLAWKVLSCLSKVKLIGGNSNIMVQVIPELWSRSRKGSVVECRYRFNI